MGKKVTVLVVDDSPICQQLIAESLSRDPDIEIVGTAANGRDAVKLAGSLKPSVITMDVDMPVMDGLAATERIMAEAPTPILMLTADPRREAPELTGRALELGALALQVKPTVDAGPEAWNLAREVKLLSSVKVIRHVRAFRKGPARVPMAAPQAPYVPGGEAGVVAIASSTGGPQVVHKLLASLPADFPVPLLIVQHINAAFTESLSAWLGASSKLRVRLAQDGDALVPGLALIAPPGQHLVVPVRGRAGFRAAEPKRDVHVPSGTVLLESVARAYGRRAIGMVLTGMGADGADGLLAIRAAGGRTLAQSEESCVVFGMPGAAIAKNAAQAVVHGDDLAAQLLKWVKAESQPLAE